MDYSHEYSECRVLDYANQHLLTLNSSDVDLVDPALELWSQSTNGWLPNKQPMHRFLSEHDQGPMLFQTTQSQESFGVRPVPGSYRRYSPPLTAISSTDSCASPPCATDFLQPRSPEMIDCVSPPIGYPDPMMAGCPTGYLNFPASYINPFDFSRRPDDPVLFDLAEKTLDCTPSPDSLPTPDSWSLPLNRSYKIEIDTNHFSEHGSLGSSPRHIDEVPSEGEDCLVVNTQPLPQGNQKRPRRQKTSTSCQANDQHMPPRKRKSDAQAIPCKRQRTRPIAVEPSSPPTMDVPRAVNSFVCHDCEKTCRFKDEQSLIKHRKIQHTRPFSCVYHFAGCQSTFASKNEWKRHVISQHLVLYYWICTEGSCAQVPISSSSSSHASQSFTPTGTGGTDAYGTVFNRKDLYTQHLRRMHVPNEYKKMAKQKNVHHGEWDKQVKEHQKNAQRTRCALPDQMDCPQAGCTHTFHGKTAWDDRMEHVARHLDVTGNASDTHRSGAGHLGGPALEFGGPDDHTLLNWSMRADVNVIRLNTQTGRWELNNPLRTSAGPRKPSTSGRTRRGSGNEAKQVTYTPIDDDEDEDAEGEDDDVYVY